MSNRNRQLIYATKLKERMKIRIHWHQKNFFFFFGNVLHRVICCSRHNQFSMTSTIAKTKSMSFTKRRKKNDFFEVMYVQFIRQDTSHTKHLGANYHLRKWKAKSTELPSLQIL